MGARAEQRLPASLAARVGKNCRGGPPVGLAPALIAPQRRRLIGIGPCSTASTREGRPQDTRVVVAMSGGVDSSVTAALLKAEGYDVVGVTLQLYDHGAATHRKGACCAGRDIHDARAVAERIGIPHYVLDYEARFKEAVIDRFAESYAAGETPVPCVECNRVDQVRRPARHRARARRAACWRPATMSSTAASPTAAARSIARMRASATRAISCSPPRASSSTCCAFRSAACRRRRCANSRANSASRSPTSRTARTSASCPTGRYADVIERLRPGAAAPGDIVDLSGRVLGRHDGIIHFTVGQRKGLKIAAREPLYVLRLEADTRRVVVGPRAALATRTIRLHDVNWIGDGALDDARAPRGVRQGALDAPAAAGLAQRRPRRRRGRTGRRRGRRRARSGLRVLRRRAKARRACSAAASSAAPRPWRRHARERRGARLSRA